MPPGFNHASVEVIENLAHRRFGCRGIQPPVEFGALDPECDGGWSEPGELRALDLASDPPVRVDYVAKSRDRFALAGYLVEVASPNRLLDGDLDSLRPGIHALLPGEGSHGFLIVTNSIPRELLDPAARSIRPDVRFLAPPCHEQQPTSEYYRRPMSIDLPAGRSTIHYPHVLAEARNLTSADVTFGVAETADFLTPSAAGVAAQIDAVSGTTRQVTITGSTNDDEFIGALTVASMLALFRALPPVRRGIASWTLIASRVDAASARARETARRLSERSRALADAEGCVSPAVRASTRDGQAWSAELWTHFFRYSSRGVAPSAPHATGMRALARMLDELLGVQAA